jgi:rod shape-determining protein MreD
VRGLVALTVFGGGIAHATVAPALRIGNVSPDIPLVVVVLLSLRRGPEFGCLAGFVAGLVQDAAGGGFIGVQAMTKALAGFAIGAASTRLRPTQPLVQVPALVVLTLAEGIVRYGLLALVRFPAGFVDVMVYVVVPQALYNGVLGAVLVTVMALVDAQRMRGA